MAALPHILQSTEGASCTSAVNISRRRTKRARVSWCRPYQLSATTTSKVLAATLTRCLKRVIIEILSGLHPNYPGAIPPRLCTPTWARCTKTGDNYRWTGGAIGKGIDDEPF